jgi:hypothetical protein
MMELVAPMIVGGLSAAVYGVYGYATGKIPGATPKDWDTTTLAGTVIVGFGMGAAMVYAGLPVEQSTVFTFAATIGFVELVQKVVKPLILTPLINWFRNIPKAPDIVAK